VAGLGEGLLGSCAVGEAAEAAVGENAAIAPAIARMARWGRKVRNVQDSMAGSGGSATIHGGIFGGGGPVS
jgi:hypothetical protein